MSLERRSPSSNTLADVTVSATARIDQTRRKSSSGTLRRLANADIATATPSSRPNTTMANARTRLEEPAVSSTCWVFTPIRADCRTPR